jgi:hypothetical protein
MYKQGKTRPQIAKATNFSFRTIQKIIDDYENSQTLSKRAQAYQLYRSGNFKPLDAAIDLDMTEKDAIEYYVEFARLNEMGEFASLYEMTNGNLRPFLDFTDNVILTIPS